MLDGAKSLVPRASVDELFIVAAELEGRGPALFIVESKTDGLERRARARDGRPRGGDRQPDPRRT